MATPPVERAPQHEWTDEIKNMRPRLRYLGVGLVILAVGLLLAGRWDLSLAVGAGALLGWAMTDPVRITWALFVLLLAVPVTIDFGYPTNPTYTLFFLLFVLAAWGRVLRAGRDGLAPRLVAAVLLLPLAVLLAGVVHWYGAKPIVVGLVPLVCLGALCWHVVEEARRDPRLIRRIGEAFTWLGAAVAVLAKYQTMTGTWPGFDQFAYDWIYTSRFDPTRAAGISGHPIIYGAFAMGMALAALVIRGRFWYVAFTANLVGVVLSGTRSAWVGMVLALALWLFFQWRRINWRGIATAAAIVAVAFAVVTVKSQTYSPGLGSSPAPGFTSGPGSTPSPHSSADAERAAAQRAAAAKSAARLKAARQRVADPVNSASANARVTRIDIAWNGITQDWSTFVFGHGPEANVRFLKTTGIHDGQWPVFDNSYLTFWYNFGLVGVVCLCLTIAGVYLRFRSVAARVLLVAFAAQIFFFDVWLWPAALGVFVLAVGLAVADDRTWSPRPLRLPLGRRTGVAAG